jgi:DNA-binding NarL/FixJ family response regulator
MSTKPRDPNGKDQQTKKGLREDSITGLNLKVLVLETDFYALQTINSYLAWDRRTRVVSLSNSVAQATEYLRTAAFAEYPDVILLEVECVPTAEELRTLITSFRQKIRDVSIVCLGRSLDKDRILGAAQAGVSAYFLRNEVGLHLVSGLCLALERPLLVTHGVYNALPRELNALRPGVEMLPREREYPEMTDRIRQALWLCVIQGMPAQLAADEMGVSPHTIRSYIKDGYRILEAYDDASYPDTMGPLERAFMRFTALALPDLLDDKEANDKNEGL